MYQPNAGLVVTKSLDIIDKYMEYSSVTTIFVTASQLGPTPHHYKVDIIFETPFTKGLLQDRICINLMPA
jgi:hypothetical protein